MTELVGRLVEMSLIDQLLENAMNGQGGAVALTGGAGIGKSTLLREARSSAERKGFEVRHVAGTPFESNLPYAALHALLAPDLRSEIPVALATAIGLRRSDAAPFVIAVAAALVGHLSAQAEQRPLLLAVDDFQWLDPSSAAAIALAADRLFADRVAILFALRTSQSESPVVRDQRFGDQRFGDQRFGKGEGQNPDDAMGVDLTQLGLLGLRTHEVLPLTTGESNTLLHQLGVDIDRSSAIASHARGVPLVMITKARDRPTIVPSDETLHDVTADYLGRLETLSPYSKQLCGLVTLDEGRDSIELILGPNFSIASEAAIAVGLVEVVDDRVRFTHPLIRTAIARARTKSETVELHAMLAEVLAGTDQTDRYVLHLAASVQDTDERVAQLLLEFSERAKNRGALVESYRAIARAAEISPEPDVAMERFLAAAEMLYFSGDAEGGAQLAKSMQHRTNKPELLLRAELVAAKASEWTRNARTTVNELTRVASLFESTNPSQAVEALSQASAMAFMAGDLDVGVTTGERARSLAERGNDPVATIVAQAHIAWNQFLAGRTAAAAENMAPIEPLLLSMIETSESLDSLLVAQRFAMQAVMVGDWALADRLSSVSIGRSRRLGFRLSAILFGCIRGALRWRCGQLEEGLTLATDELEEQTLPPLSYCWASASAAQIAAALGRVDEAEAFVDNALRVARTLEVPLVQAWALAARGHLYLSQGNAPRALTMFEAVADLTERMGLREPGFFLWHGDYVECLLACGRTDQARAALQVLDGLVLDTGRAWAEGVSVRCRAALDGYGPHANEQFEVASDLFEKLGMPFEVARTNLLWSTMCPDRHEARKRAEGMFRAMGATIWAERAMERRRSTDSTETPLSVVRSSIFELLSAAESRVALSLSAGKTNREVAEELHVSVRTIEFHLNTIYRKTSVKNRSALIAHLRE